MWEKIRVGTRAALTGTPLIHTGAYIRFALLALGLILAIGVVTASGLQAALEQYARLTGGPIEPKGETAIWVGVIGTALSLFGALFLLMRATLPRLILPTPYPPPSSMDISGLTERDQLIEQLREQVGAERERRMMSESLGQVSRNLNRSLDLYLVLNEICDQAIQIFGADAGYLWLKDRDDLAGFAAHGQGADEAQRSRFPIADPKLLAAPVIREEGPLIVNEAAESYLLDPKLVQTFKIQSMLAMPLIKDGQPLGALMIIDTYDPNRFGDQDVETATVFAEHAVAAIQNALLYEKSQRHLQHQLALHRIDQMITSGVELPAVLDTLLQQTIARLMVDAADVLLLDPSTKMLNYEHGLGFRTYRIQHARVPLEEPYTGRAAREQVSIAVELVEDALPPFERYSLVAGENFVSYAVTPLIAGGRTLGVLEVFHRTRMSADDDWLEFFETLAGQAAIAIENSNLISGLRRSNADLSRAYDEAIHGWAAALELRHHDSGGHTRRVTELAERLARHLGMPEEELVQLRRGAMLHDIGKIAIPDSILLKSESLTEEEQRIMREHPQHALNLLSRIGYLEGALDIPYCHHEFWDGTGYPRGLKGEQIPLAARIFSIADVYDALTSERPYRAALSKSETLAYLRERAGLQFDPSIVESFLALSETKP